MKKTLIISIFLLYLVSCTKREVIFERETDSEYELALILNLNGKDCFFDVSSNTLKYSIDENSLNNFSPFTMFQEYSEVNFNGISLINNSINNFGFIVLDTPYDIEIKTNDNISIIKLVFTNTPLIQIVTIDEIRNEPKIIGEIHVNYPDISKPTTTSYIGIEIRGRSTASLDKKSYGFKPLNSKKIKDQTVMSFFDMGTNSKWMLDAMAIEKSKLRNKTSFEIWNSLSNKSIKSHYVELFLNNNSLGLYRFSEAYTEYLLQMNINSRLYVGIDNSEYTKFTALPARKPKSALWEDWEQKYPDPSDQIYWDDFYQLSKLIVQGDDATFIENIENYIDFNNVVDYYLFVNLCYGYDNTGKNWFFFKKHTTSKFEILLWDLDATWGRDFQAKPITYNKHISNNLFERLFMLNPNGFKEKLQARWILLRTRQFSEISLINIFDSNFKEVIEISKKTSKNQMNSEYSEIEAEQPYINDWIINRLNFLDNYYDNL